MDLPPLASAVMEMSLLGDELLVSILAMASSWPHTRVQLTCARFSRLVPAFRRLAVETFGIDETLMISSLAVSGSWLLDQERGRWLRCADPPAAPGFRVCCAAALGHEVVVHGVDYTNCLHTLAFYAELNTWRRLPNPFGPDENRDRCQKLVTMGDERVSAHPTRSHLCSLVRAQVVAKGVGPKYALYDGHVWTPIPTVPVRDVLDAWRIATLDGTVYLTNGRALKTARTVFAYDTVTGTWTERELSRGGGSCSFLLGVAGSLYSFGRLLDGSSRVDIYDPATESRTTAAHNYDLGVGNFVHFNTKLWRVRYNRNNHTYDDPVAIYDWGKIPGVAQTKSLLPSLPSFFSIPREIHGIAVNPHR